MKYVSQFQHVSLLAFKERMRLIPIRILVPTAPIKRQILPGRQDQHHPMTVVCNNQHDS